METTNIPQATSANFETLETKLNQLSAKLDSIVVSKDWLPKKLVQNFLGYKNVTMHRLMKNNSFVISKTGRKIFISKVSVEEFLQKHKV